MRERASSSGEAAGALDEEDATEGVLVRRGPDLPREKPTPSEVQELRQHDEQVREEKAQQEREDQEAYQRFRASQMQQWEDWAMTSEMNVVPEPAMKRVRVTMVLGMAGGGTVAEGTLEGTMPVAADPMVTMAMSHQILVQTAESTASLVHQRRTLSLSRTTRLRSSWKTQRPRKT